MSTYQPNFNATNEILMLTATILEKLHACSPHLAFNPDSPKLRRDTLAKTIQGSLAIEANTLTLDQVTALVDGNGRKGRLWPTLLLSTWNSLFSYLVVEEIVKYLQQQYYEAINSSTMQNNTAPFVTFMLQAIDEALGGLSPGKMQVSPYVEKLLAAMGTQTLSAQERMQAMGLSNRPSFMRVYLHPALELGCVEMTLPDKPNSRLQKYRARLR